MAITDLKGMTVTIPAGWTATAGYGKFAVDVTNSSGSWSEFDVGYNISADGFGDIVSQENYVAFGDYSYWSYPSTTSFDLTFTGGTDTTNANLIAWVEANMEKATPTATFDLTTLDLPEGTHTISVIGKAEGYKASAASAGVSYTVEPSGVTLAAGTYVANDVLTKDTNFDFDLNYSALIFKYNNIIISDELIYKHYPTDTDNVERTGIAYNFLDSTWTADIYKTIVLETDQEVSAEFATWFNANFTKQPDGVTLAAGTYVANTGFFPSGVSFDENLNFTSNGINFNSIAVSDNYMTYGNTDVFEYSWYNTAYKTITLETDQTVSPEFGEWFNSNFTKQTHSGGAY